MKRLALLVGAFLLVAHTSLAQSLATVAKKTEEERAAAAKKAHPVKVITEKDLDTRPAPVIGEAPKPTAGLAASTAAQNDPMSEVRHFKMKYGADSQFMSMFRHMPDEGFGRTQGTTTDVKRASINAEFGGQVLLHRAEEKLKTLK